MPVIVATLTNNAVALVDPDTEDKWAMLPEQVQANITACTEALARTNDPARQLAVLLAAEDKTLAFRGNTDDVAQMARDLQQAYQWTQLGVGPSQTKN